MQAFAWENGSRQWHANGPELVENTVWNANHCLVQADQLHSSAGLLWADFDEKGGLQVVILG